MSGLSKKIEKDIQTVFFAFPEIEKAVLYGSRAKGNFKTGSDIDLTLFGKNLNLKTIYKVQEKLDELYLPYKFDLSIYEHIDNPDLREHIDRVGLEFYRREDDSGVGARKGWAEKRLGEVCEIKPQKIEARKKLKPNQMVSFVPMEDLGIGQKEFIPKKERLLSDVEGSYTYFADDDVLLAKITPCFENGKLGIAKNLRNGIGFGSSEYIVFRTDKTLYNEFLYYFLSQEVFRTNGAKNMSGAVGHKRVAKEFIEATQIPLPPLPEQKRIVAILDKAFAEISRAKEIAEKNLANSKEVFESYLQGVFANPGDGWEEKAFSELCDIKHGYAFDGAYFSNKGEYVLLTPGNFYESGGYRDRGEKQKYYNGEIPHDYILNKGDLLVAMTEQAAGLLGSPILVPESNRFLHNQRLGLVTAKSGVPWRNDFFFHAFNTKVIRKSIHDSASGVKVRHTSPTKIGEAIVKFPSSIAEQKKIVKTFTNISAETKKLEEIYKQKISNLEELKKSLLQKAFSGELTGAAS